MLKVAVALELRGTVVRVFSPSVNLIEPASVPAPGATTLTVAVKVTDWLMVEGFADEVNVVAVEALFTVWAIVEELELKFASPLYDAVKEGDSLSPLGDKRMTAWRTTMQPIRRIVVAVVGGTVLALGIALIVLPGPAFVVIPAGLAILALEFAWARRWLRSAHAILPRRSKNNSAPPKKLTVKSVRRSGSFLLRQAHRTLVPKRNL